MLSAVDDEPCAFLTYALMVEPAHLIGRTISHYRILAKLGQGGMGEVYRARDTSLHRDIALKVLPQAIVVDPLRRQRFVHEARAASALEHPHIAVIHEIGEDQGVTSIAMELVRGEPLDALAMAVLNIVFLMRGLALVLPIAPAVDQGEKSENRAGYSTVLRQRFTDICGEGRLLNSPDVLYILVFGEYFRIILTTD